MEYSKYIIIGLLSGLDNTWPYFKRLPGTTYPWIIYIGGDFFDGDIDCEIFPF